MEGFWGGILWFIEWCGNNPDLLFWVLLPAGLVFAWAVYKIIRISILRVSDSQVIKELVNFQIKANSESMSAEERIKGVSEILKTERNTMTLLLYKYCLSNKNFDKIIAAYTYPEYIKVGKQSPSRAGRFTKIGVFSVTLLILTLWAYIVSIGAATDTFSEVIHDGSLTGAFWNSLILPSIVLGFYFVTVLLLFLYLRIVKKYKIVLFEILQEGATEFFAAIEQNYDEFTHMTVRTLNPNEVIKGRIKKLVAAEGGQFRQRVHDKLEGKTLSDLEYDEPAKMERRPKKIAGRVCARVTQELT